MTRNVPNQRRRYAASIEGALDIQEARPQNLRDKAQVIAISLDTKVVKQSQDIGTRPSRGFGERLEYFELVGVETLIPTGFACEGFDGTLCASRNCRTH